MRHRREGDAMLTCANRAVAAVDAAARTHRMVSARPPPLQSPHRADRKEDDMHARKRNLLALAVAAVLVPALALADKPAGTGHGAAPTAPTTSPTVTLPTPAVEHAGDALVRNPNYDPASTKDVGRKAAGKVDADDGDDDAMDDGDRDDDATTDAHASAAQTNPGKGNWWADADADSDGRLSRSEAGTNSGVNAHFASIDKNGDGFVTREEYQAYFTATASKGEQHAADHSAVVTRDVYARLDADLDGRLAAGEVEGDAQLKADFGAIDTNDDGFVSDDEYRAYYRSH
jgi:hypothetical protein